MPYSINLMFIIKIWGTMYQFNINKITILQNKKIKEVKK